MKTKKQIKAREATKRQRKARKKHAYKSIFCDRAKAVKNKSNFLTWCKQRQQSVKTRYNAYTGRYELAIIDETASGDWRELYEKTKQDIIYSSRIDNGLAGSLDFDSSGKIICR